MTFALTMRPRATRSAGWTDSTMPRSWAWTWSGWEPRRCPNSSWPPTQATPETRRGQ